MLLQTYLHRPFVPLLALGAIALAPLPTRAADTVYLDFGVLGRSIPTESLAHFAETGEVDTDLAPFLRRLTP